MKCLILAVLITMLIVSATNSYGQWATSGNDIYNTNTGTVGIATTTPTATLDVNGTGNIRGSVNFGGGGGVYANVPASHTITYRGDGIYNGKGLQIGNSTNGST